ncbi:hypothetical protein ACKWTF_016488 [Chironomus riparius]
MGRYEKYFCLSIQSTLICMGVIMSIVSMFANLLNLRIFISMMDTDHLKGNSLAPVIAVLTIVFLFIYTVHAVLQCSLCCRACYKNPVVYFKLYIICLSIVALCALTDAVLKFMLIPALSIFYFIFFIALVFCIIVALMARQELMEVQIKELIKFNSGQGGSIIASKDSVFPKYAMPLQVEKLENGSSSRAAYGNLPEAQPLNKAY